MLNLLVVTVVHHPLDARIYHRQIRALVAQGSVVSYAAPFSATATDPALLPVEVRPIDLPRASGRDRIRALRAARRLLRTVVATHDMVLLHDPELVLAILGQRRRLPPVVLDVHEDLASSLSDRPWVPRMLRPAARVGARLLERYAESRLHLILAEEDYQERFRQRHPVVRNLPWLPPAPGPPDQPPRIVYVGRLSVARGALDLLAVAEELWSQRGLRMQLVGPADRDVEPALRRAVAAGSVRWYGFLPNDRAMDVVRGSTVGLSLLHDHPNYVSSRPTKLIEYLAHGVPVVSTPLPAAVALIDNNPFGCCGVLVPYRDPEAVVRAVIALLDAPEELHQMAKNGRTFVQHGHSWEAESKKFREVLIGVAGVG